jgi:hypothetical protein
VNKRRRLLFFALAEVRQNDADALHMRMLSKLFGDGI